MRRFLSRTADVTVRRPKAHIETTDEGKVSVHVPKLGGVGSTLTLSPDEAEVIAQNLLMYAFVAEGGTPTEEHHRAVRQMRLR